MKRRPKDDHYCQQVQGGLADIGNGTLCARAPEAGGEPDHSDAPAADRESQKDPIEPDSAARSHVRMGWDSVRRP
jgi:hypothetical protein